MITGYIRMKNNTALTVKDPDLFMTQNKNIGHKMLEVIVGSDFDVISNDYNEIDSHTDKFTSQQIVFQFKVKLLLSPLFKPFLQ